MDRRSLIQALGLAPLAALISGKADAAPALSVRETWEQEKAQWEERKLFTLGVQVPKLELVAPDWNLGEQEPLPFFRKIEKIIHSSTKTPDVRDVAKIAYYDKSGAPWGPSYEQYNERLTGNFYEITDFVDLSGLFVHGAQLLQRHVATRAQQIIEMTMGPFPEIEGHPGFRRPVIGHKMLLLKNVRQPGVFEGALSTLASLELSYFYYGPSPYPPTGKLHTFCDGTGTWAEFRPAT